MKGRARMHVSTISRWMFRLDDDPDAWKKDADEQAFRPVRVPHDWAVEADFDPACSSGTGYLPGGVGWYRAHCSISGLGVPASGALRLVFHGVYKNAEVWVNGYHLGGRPNGHVEFSFDLTELIGYAPDDDLVISVRVDHRDLADSRWYNGSGLTRRVELEVHDQVSLAPHGTVVTTRAADHERAELGLVQRLENHGDAAASVLVTHLLEPLADPRATEVPLGTHRLELAARGSAEVSLTAEVLRPRLWSDADPNLYRLVTTITDVAPGGHGGGQPARHEQVVGIRTCSFDPDSGFWANGERRVLKGVCLHEDAGCLGVAVPREVWLRRLLTLKDAGCNAVRMAHNPHAPELYELCDQLGFYVIDEAFDEWENPKNKWWRGHNVYPPKHEGYAHDYPAWHVADLTAMVRAHRWHASVIAWSIGNEIDYPNDPYASPLFDEMTGNNDANKPADERVYNSNRPDARRLTTLANELIEVVRAADNTRPVTLAAAFPELSSRTGLLDRLDLIGYNYKEHLYAGDHVRFPEQPFVGSETGHSHAAWRQVVDQEFVAGQFLWTGIDYFGETVGWPSHGSQAGLLTTAGFPKERWHQRRSWWADEPVLRLATRPLPQAGDHHERLPFTRTWEAGEPVQVACFTTADEVSVRHGTTPVAMSWDADLGCWIGTTTAGAEPLLAEARVGGATLRDEILPAGDPAAITAQEWLAPERWRHLAGAAAGDESVPQVECRLVDVHGQPARGELEVDVAVSGGDLLGIDSGDLSDTTPCRATRRRTFGGRLLVHVRGTRPTLTLRASGLTPTTLECVGRPAPGEESRSPSLREPEPSEPTAVGAAAG